MKTRTELVSNLRRHASEILSELAEHRDPVLITQHGKPAAYLVDVETFQALEQRLSALEVITRGVSAVEEGRVLTHEQAKKRLHRWLK